MDSAVLSTIMLSDKKKSAAKFSVVIIFFKVFMCGGRVCLFVCAWMHVG